MVILYILAALVSIALGIVLSFPLWGYWLAEKNFFFTTIPEGRAKIVVKGEDYVRTIISWRDHHLDKNGDVVDSSPSDPPLVLNNWWDRLLSRLGIYWVGIHPWRSIYSYKFSFSTVEQGQVKARNNEVTEFVFLNDYVYFVVVKDAETGGAAGSGKSENVPIDVGLLLTIRVKNPYKALFRVQKWLETVSNKVQAKARDYLGTKTFDELISQGKEVEKELDENLNETKKMLLEEYGIDIRKIEIHEVQIVGGNKDELREASTREFVAKKNKERSEIEGEGLAAAAKGLIDQGVNENIATAAVLLNSIAPGLLKKGGSK
ncbi:MAG TPA: hypothetical protein ENN31_01380 [Candidatus Vogelbacteria bacterium]|nr:hypothetical protein [Candidatus Vogelbacteria bacterium]